MKVTRILDFTEDEINSLTVAGHILGDLAKVYGEETADEIVLGATTKDLINALKEVLYKLDRDDAKYKDE